MTTHKPAQAPASQLLPMDAVQAGIAAYWEDKTAGEPGVFPKGKLLNALTDLLMEHTTLGIRERRVAREALLAGRVPACEETRCATKPHSCDCEDQEARTRWATSGRHPFITLRK